MAQVDSRIALGVQPLDVGASIGRGYQLRDLAAQADARKLDTQLKQQAVQKQKTLGDLYRGALGPDGKIDRAKVTQGVVEAGFGADLPDMQKQWSDADKAEADYFSKNSETIVKQLEYTSKAIGALLQNPNTTAQDVARAVSGLTQFGLLKPEQGAEIVRSIPGDPVQLRQYLQGKLMESQQAKDMLTAALPNLKEINLGGHTQIVDANPLTNPGIAGQQLQRTATPGELEQQRHNQVMEQRQAAQGQREQTQIVTDADGGVHIVNKQTGQSQTATDAQGNPIIGKGGLSQEQLKNASAKKQTVEILRKQLDNLKVARANLGSMDYGVIAGRQAVTDSARAYDGALAALQSTVRQLTRTPGEGAMSDFESRIAMAQLPGRVDPSGVIDQKITQLEDLANIVEQGYSDMLNRSGGRAQPKPAQPTQSASGGVLSPQQSGGSPYAASLQKRIDAGLMTKEQANAFLQSKGLKPEFGNDDPRTGSW